MAGSLHKFQSIAVRVAVYERLDKSISTNEHLHQNSSIKAINTSIYNLDYLDGSVSYVVLQPDESWIESTESRIPIDYLVRTWFGSHVKLLVQCYIVSQT